MAGKKYVVSAPLVSLKVPDAAGGLIYKTFYSGAPVPEDVDPDNLQHHIDSQLVLEESDDLAEIVAVPAGTPIPGEPPNVPVTETTPAPKTPEQRLEAAKQAVESGRKSSSKQSESSKSEQSSSSSSKSE